MNYWLFIFLFFFQSVQKTPEEYTIEKLDNRINSEFDEINPVISRDGKTMYFTRVGYPDFNRSLYDMDVDISSTMPFAAYQSHLIEIFKSMGDGEHATADKSTFNQDIWIAKGDGMNFSNLFHPEYPVNSALPNSVCSLTPNSNEIIIINEFYKDGSMYKGFSTLKGNGHDSWQFPKPLFIYDFFSTSSEVNLTMSSDANIIILSLNRPSSKGDNDLYVSMKIEENLYSTPLPLDDNINTTFRESTPFISRDGQYLFFSSSRPGGYGGNDIYVSRRLDGTWQNWEKPRLLPKLINSDQDDSQPFVNESTGYMYFTSRRDGSSDIFRVQYNPVSKEIRNKTLEIHVVNSLTGQPEEADVAIGWQTDGFYNKSLGTENGTVTYSFVTPKNIMVKGRRKGFTAKNTNLNLDSLFQNEISIRDVTIYVEPIDKEANFVLKNIYFEQSTAIIKENSYEALDILVEVLKRNPELKMKIFGHTDNVGSEASLRKLSQDRAIAIKSYLVKNQIDAGRITTEGMGSSKPLNDNSTEEKKSQNRRVEFTVYK